MKAVASSAITAEKACAIGPKTPLKAVIDSTEAISMLPTPTGLMSYRCARLNSMPGGDRPSGLLMTRSATIAPTQAMATFEYRPSTCSSALNTPSCISTSAMATLNTTQTTRPGWLWVTRAKKFDQASEPA